MKRQYKFTALSAVLFCLIGLLYGCTRDNEIIIPETSVNPPATDYSVAIGDEVTFTGQNMHLISKGGQHHYRAIQPFANHTDSGGAR